MENHRLKMLFTIVDKALSLSPDERNMYLNDVCGDDDAFRKEVDELLQSVGDSEEFWNEWQEWNEQQIEEIFQGEDKRDQEFDGKQIGPWRLIEKLGEGGMGVVYLAERADGSYRKKVALKVLRTMYRYEGTESPTIHRFKQERQILARLEHPNIARLYDGGHTEDGLPWLAMEYIDGIPVTQWCRQHNCSLNKRLNLFKKICEAIRYAHKNLIVHRDLKPENILVTGDGQVKILDFGIAKLLDDELTADQKHLTQTGFRAVSLYYAAPEQLNDEPITTATDVYALGLLLYELLAGIHPFTFDGLKVHRVEQMIRSEEPIKPSAVPMSDSVYPGRQDIRGDLDAITMKALRKEPDKRYENAGHMLDDIIRYQKNIPLIARRDSTRYRFGKFLKRHRRALVTGMMILLGVIGLIAYHTLELAKERNIAQQEAQRAEQTTQFLAELFLAADPSEARGTDITAQELLNRGADRIKDLAGQPELQAKMMQLIGRVYWSIGSYEEALPLLEQAIELHQTFSDNADPDYALAHFSLGLVLHDQGDYQQSVPHFEKAVEIFRMKPGHMSPEYATSLENLGSVEGARRNYTQAEELNREALDMRLTLFGPDHPDVGKSYFSIATLRYHQNDLDGAIDKTREALRIFRLNDMVDTRLGARMLRHLGSRLIEKGEYSAADAALTEALDINKRIHGDKYLDTGLVVWSMATLNRDRGNFIAAEQLYDEALSILQKAIGDRHVMVGQVLQELGGVYTQTHNHFQAEHVYRESLEIFGTAERVHPQRIVTSQRKLGSTLVNLRRYEEAEELLLENLVATSAMAAENEDNEEFVTRSLEELVVLYNEWGRIEQSEQYRDQLAGELGK